ncbi:hypothetical protein GCM10010129_38990 [Streptomyces fumigatiscleroticus]|nr:hypothetical protein GCM10010129_38990 [Streptomyces fumigatiscleroticus]
MRLTTVRAAGRRRRRRGTAQRGRTSWRRFAVAVTCALALAAGTVATTTAASIPVSFAVAGSPFSVTARRLEADHAVQFASFREDASGRHRPVAVVGIRQADIRNLCQSAVAHTPLGTVTLQIRAGHARPVRASGLALDLARLEGDMTFRSVEMGRDAATLEGGLTGPAGSYGQQAQTLTIENMRLRAWSLTAGVFALDDATMDVRAGEHRCG